MSEEQLLLPTVVRDARFRAGRTLMTRGQPLPATTIFVQLLDACRQKYGEDNIECAAAYYEYGNALFRCLGRPAEEEAEEAVEDNEKKIKGESEGDQKRQAAALAAEKRAQQQSTEPSSATKVKQEQEGAGDDQKPAAVKSEASTNEGEEKDNDGTQEEEEEEDSETDDMELSLEMMETGWCILDKHMASSSRMYQKWGKEQLPRYLTGIGDVLSALERYADAAEVYSQALEHRQAEWESLQSMNNANASSAASTTSLEQLVCRRRMVDLYVLMAEQFLAASPDQDVVTSETNTLLCGASERTEYAQGYYNKARDELQETVLLMGQLVASSSSTTTTSSNSTAGSSKAKALHTAPENGSTEAELDQEKENVCFTSTLLMNLGTVLATLEEEAKDSNDTKEPAQKKKKTSK